MNRKTLAKKTILIMTIFVYILSSLLTYLNEGFSIIAGEAKEETKELINTVAVFVDDKIYEKLQSDLEWYTTKYIQQEIPGSKAIIIPINLKNIHAYELYRILENIYFEGIEGENSNLIGTILVGDIPFPVINQNGYLFPSIYPYVDFIDQKYIRSQEAGFFVPNNNLAGQAEIWHGVINYKNNIDKYVYFFQKLKSYTKNPDSFIGDHMWYEDFIAQKNGYIDSRLDYYENKVLFAEDIGYIRYSPLMLSLFKSNQDENNNDMIEELNNIVGEEREQGAITEQTSENGAYAKVTDQSIKESYIKSYSDLFSSQNGVAQFNNSFAGGRYIDEYGNKGKDLKTKTHSSTTIIDLKDTVTAGNDSVEGVLIGFNNKLEAIVDSGVNHNQMDIVIPSSYRETLPIKLRKIKKSIEDFTLEYKNYYFGKLVDTITKAKDLSIYRGTRRNLTFEDLQRTTQKRIENDTINPSKSNTDNTDLSLKSLGGSYDIFATQVEANRGYNFLNMQTEYDTYQEKKTYRETEKNGDKKRRILGVPFGWKTYKYDPVGECNPGDGNDENDADCEDIYLFSERHRGGASPLNLDTNLISQGIYKLSGYDYKKAKLEIFDIAGSKKIEQPETEANSFLAGEKYGSLIASKYAHIFEGKRKKFANEPTAVEGYYEDPTKLAFFKRAGLYDKNKCKGSLGGFSCTTNDNKKNTRITKPKAEVQKHEEGQYDYRVINSVLKNDTISYEEYNGYTTRKFGTGRKLYRYYQDILNEINKVDESLNTIDTEFQKHTTNLKNNNKKLNEILNGTNSMKSFFTLLQQTEKDANRIECSIHTESYTNDEGETTTTTSYTPRDTTNKGQNLIDFQNAYFSGREEKFADVIMYFYDESINFQDTVDDFSLVTFDNLLGALNFIRNKELLDLPLDFSGTRIRDVENKINQLKNKYNKTYEDYKNTFTQYESLKGTINKFPDEINKGISTLEGIENRITTQRNISHKDCKNLGTELFKNIEEVLFYYQKEMTYQYSHLSGSKDFFVTTFYPNKDEEIDREFGEKEYNNAYQYLSGEIKKLKTPLDEYQNAINDNAENLLNFYNSLNNGSLYKDFLAYNVFLQQNNQYLHKGREAKTELNLKAGELYYTGDMEEYAEHPEIKFKDWEDTLRYGISEIERFHHLSGIFYKYPSRNELTSMNNSIPGKLDLYRVAVERLHNGFNEVIDEHKAIQEQLNQGLEELKTLDYNFVRKGNFWENENKNQKSVHYIQKNILSPLKDIEINAKTGACTIMRTRRQDACTDMALSGTTLSQNMNLRINTLLYAGINTPGTNLLTNITGNCQSITNTGKGSLSGLQILDKKLTGTLTTLVTTGINEIKQIYNIRTGQITTCQKNFKDSREEQQKDCSNNFDKVCANWANQTWNGEYYKQQKSDCIKRTKDEYSVCYGCTTTGCSNEKCKEKAFCSLGGTGCIQSYLDEYSICGGNRNSTTCNDTAERLCKDWNYYINNYEKSLDNCKTFCFNNYKKGINNYNHSGTNPSIQSSIKLIENQISSFSWMYQIEMNRPTKWKKIYGAEETRTDGNDYEYDSITCNEIKAKYEACNNQNIYDFTYQKNGQNQQSQHCTGWDFKSGKEKEEEKVKCDQERKDCTDRWTPKKNICFIEWNTASGYFYGGYKNKRTETKNVKRMELDKCIIKANDEKEPKIPNHISNFSGNCTPAKITAETSCTKSVDIAQKECLNTRTNIINNCTTSGNYYVGECQKEHDTLQKLCNKIVGESYTGQYSTAEENDGDNRKEQQINCSFQEIKDHCEDYYTQNTNTTSGYIQCQDLKETKGMDCQYTGIQCQNYYEDIKCPIYTNKLAGEYDNMQQSLANWLTQTNRSGRITADLNTIFAPLNQAINSGINNRTDTISGSIETRNNHKGEYALCIYPNLFPMSPIYKLMYNTSSNNRKNYHPYDENKIQHFSGYSNVNGYSTIDICPILYQTRGGEIYNCEPYYLDGKRGDFWYNEYEKQGQPKERYEIYYNSGQSSDDCTGCLNIAWTQNVFTVLSGLNGVNTGLTQELNYLRDGIDLNIKRGNTKYIYYTNLNEVPAYQKVDLDKNMNEDFSTYMYCDKHVEKLDTNILENIYSECDDSDEEASDDDEEELNDENTVCGAGRGMQCAKTAQNSGFKLLFKETFKQADDELITITGLNMLTLDKPIDSPRYVTFQSFAGREVKFIYPNLFKVEVYKKKDGNSLTLKSIDEIEQAIYTYLENQVKSYNTILRGETTINQNNKAGYDILKKIGLYSATPYEKNGKQKGIAYYNVDDFIKGLGGKQQIRNIAEILYYQNLTNKERFYNENIIKDIQNTRDTFDINNKLKYVLEEYLVSDNAKDVSVLPNYQNSGYEVGYFNSDGEDLIFEADQQEKQTKTKGKINYNWYKTLHFKEQGKIGSSPENNDKDNENGNANLIEAGADKCGIPMNEGLLIFKFENGKVSSPWLEGFKCWIEEIKDVHVSFNFNEARGPVIAADNLGDAVKSYEDSIKESVQGWGDNMEKYLEKTGIQTFQDVTLEEGKILSTNELIGLKSDLYNYVNLNIDKSIVGVEETTNLFLNAPKKDFGIVTIEFSSTGEDCLLIDNKESCTTSTKKTINMNNSGTIVPIATKNHKMGKTLIVTNLCPGTRYKEDDCVKKTTILERKAGPLNTITISGNTLHYEGFGTPLQIQAFDAFGNQVITANEEYLLSTNVGYFIYNGREMNEISLDNFKNMEIQFFAPKEFKDGDKATITLKNKKDGTEKATKQITLKKLSLIIKDKGQTITDLTKGISKTLDNENTYYKGTLEISFVDANNKPINIIPNLIKEGQNIGFSVQKGLIAFRNDKELKLSGIASIKGNSASIEYYESKIANTDQISIKIPGYQSVSIPLTIEAASPYFGEIILEKSHLALGESTKGTLSLNDRRGNPSQKEVECNITSSKQLSLPQSGKMKLKNGAEIKVTGNMGGRGHVFYQILQNGEILSTDSAEVSINQSLLPTENLNVLYGNYFGTDWGNEWGYFSEHHQYLENVMAQSPKMITATTQLIDENNIKQTVLSVNSDFSFSNFNHYSIQGNVENHNGRKELKIGIGDIAQMKIPLYDLTIRTVSDIDNAKDLINEGKNLLLFLSNEYSLDEEGKILQNGEEKDSIRKVGLTLTEKKTKGYQTWEAAKYGDIVLILPKVKLTKDHFILSDNKYLLEKTFENGSTDQYLARGIFDTTSYFKIDSSYKSIQDSAIRDNGIGFIGDFKNITLFAQGQRVGDATKEYGSELMINLGDPLLKKYDKNHTIKKTAYEGGIGNEIFSDPAKTIFKVKIIDFNNDHLKDLLVVYTDGTVKLAKNYGVEPYFRKLDTLLFLVSDIEDVYVGDVDDNKYEDIIIKTSVNQLRAYTNKEGKFDVDGYPICLNTNVSKNDKGEDEISKDPINLSGVIDLFLEDMDKDGNLDIITNDLKGYIKIFYGGKTSKGFNYLSKNKEFCDSDRYERQKDAIETVDHNGIRLIDEKIVDSSMIHRKGLSIPEEQNMTPDLDTSDLTDVFNAFEGQELKPEDIDKIKAKSQEGTNTILNSVDSESLATETADNLLKYQEIDKEVFVPISYLDFTNNDQSKRDPVEVYKKYKDLNGKDLEPGDKVKVTVTIKSRTENVLTGTFGDIINGPWSYDENPKIFGAPNDIKISNGTLKGGDDMFTYLIEDFVLQKGKTLEYSYTLTYTGYPSVRIDSVEDINGKDYGKDFGQDTYLDITLQPSNFCNSTKKVFKNKRKKDIKAGSFSIEMLDFQELEQKTATESQNPEVDKTLEDAQSNDMNTVENLITDKTTPKRSILETIGLLNNKTIDINAFDDFLEDNILGHLDEISKGLCNGFTIGGKNSCKGLPVISSTALLAPGEYKLLGCIDLPPLTQTIGKGVPVFHFPGTMYVPTPAGATPIPFPRGMKNSTSDGFLRMPGGFEGISSMFRTYVAPTTTAQVGVAMCLGPYGVAARIPSPIGDLGGNCIITVIKPQCKKEQESDTDTREESYEPYIAGLQNGNSCSSTPKGPLASIKGYEFTPFMHTNTPVEKNQTSQSFINNLDGSYVFGLIEINVSPERNSTPDHQSKLSFANIEKGGATKNKIKGSFKNGLRKMIFDNWLDPQLRYIITNLTKMNLTVKWPNFNKYSDAVKNISKGYTDFKESLQKSKKTQTGINEVLGTGLWTGAKNLFTDQFYETLSQKTSNPFEQLSKFLSNNDLLSFSTKDITVKIPWITTEDINGYSIYLLEWLEKNQKIMNKRKKIFSSLGPLCFEPSEEKKAERKEKKEQKKKQKEEQNQNENDEENQWMERFASIKDDMSQWSCSSAELQDMQVMFEFIQNFEKLSDQVYENIRILQEYRELPFQIYERSHVLDRYISEMTSIINNFLGYFSYWLTTNAHRYKQYVEAIILVINTIRSYQVLIDFSANWSEKCSTCSVDNYDQYMCKFSALFSKFDAFKFIQIPNFKLPNITLDFSDIKLGMNIVLPSFNFQTINVDLPELPDLPEAPTLDININGLLSALLDKDLFQGLHFIKGFKDLIKQIEGKEISIPTLPSPPSLPEIPSFIPNIEFELPVLPPAPAVPKIPNEFKSVINILEKIGKLLCMVKGFGLVSEKNVKAKIEQLSQRTYEVPYWDNIMDFTNALKIDAKGRNPVGFDFEISSHVNFQIDSSAIYEYLDGITEYLNEKVYGFENNINTNTQKIEKKMNETRDNQIQEREDGINKGKQKAKEKQQDLENEINKRKQKIKEEIGINLTELQKNTSDQLEYVPYDEAKQSLLSALSTFEKKAENSQKTTDQIKEITSDIHSTLEINPNLNGVQDIQTQINTVIEKEKGKILLATTLLSGNSLDPLLAYLEQGNFTKDKEVNLAFSLPFFTADEKSIQKISTLDDPVEMLLQNKTEIIDEYLNTIDGCENRQETMGTENYRQTRTILKNLKENLAGVYQQRKETKAETTLLAYKDIPQSTTKTLIAGTNTNSSASSETTNTTSMDLSAYTNGIFVRNTEGNLTKALYSEEQTKKVGTNYFLTDLNEDKQEEIILWDTHNIYIKYGDQNENTAKLNKTPNINKDVYRIDTLQEFENKDTTSRTSMGKKINIKISSPLEEVKNFKVKSQTFDTLSFSWQKAENDQVVGYLIKFENRIDTSPEKTHSDKERNEYLLVLPQGFDYNEVNIKFDGEKAKLITEYLEEGKEILELRTFNTSLEVVNAGIENIDRMWKYARITTLIKDETEGYLKVGSPRSNQVVAGRQILGDDEPPAPEIQLIREKIKDDNIVSEGDVLDGFVGTYYTLKVTRKDNVGLKHIALGEGTNLKTSKNKKEKDTNKPEDTLELKGLFFTGLDTYKYQISATDLSDNIQEQTINLVIKAPDLELTSIEETESGGIITATLSQDIDEGNISFQRNRGYRSDLKTTDQKQYRPVTTKVEIVSGAFYNISDTIGLFSDTGELMVEINPKNGEITFLEEYKNRLEIKVAVIKDTLMTPLIKIYDKETNQTLFNITLPIQEIIGIKADNYTKKEITDPMNQFYQGTAIIKDNETPLLISDKGILYANDTLEGEYQFNDDTITYYLGGVGNKKDIEYQIRVLPFSK